MQEIHENLFSSNIREAQEEDSMGNPPIDSAQAQEIHAHEEEKVEEG